MTDVFETEVEIVFLDGKVSRYKVGPIKTLFGSAGYYLTERMAKGRGYQEVLDRKTEEDVMGGTYTVRRYTVSDDGDVVFTTAKDTGGDGAC